MVKSIRVHLGCMRRKLRRDGVEARRMEREYPDQSHEPRWLMGFLALLWHWMLTFGTSVLGSSVHLANQRAAISSLQALFGLCLLVQ